MSKYRESIDDVLDAMSDLYAIVAERRTDKQVRVANLYRQENRQDSVAQLIGITQQAVSDSLRTGHFEKLESSARALAKLLGEVDCLNET